MVTIMMPKDDAIVLAEAVEIMESLPSQMRRDDQIMESLIESLQSGVPKLAARQDALEIAQLKLQETVAHGFSLVNNEIKDIKHEAEKDRIHANYAQKAAEQARAIAEQAWLKTQEVAIGVAKAEAKADGARDLAKQPRGFGIDPFWGMGLTAIAILVTLAFFTRVEKVEDSRPRTNSQQSVPTYSCDNSVVNAGTTDFSKCRRLGEV